MTKWKGSPDLDNRSPILKLPEPPTLLESLQTKLAALNIDPEMFRLVESIPDPVTGKTTLIAQASQEFVDAYIQSQIKLHEPDNIKPKPTIHLEGDNLVVDQSGSMTDKDAKGWLAAEKVRRAKAQGDESNLPDH